MPNTCRYCGSPINWGQNPQTGKSKPVNPDGTDHRCQQAQATQPPAQYGQPTQVHNPPQGYNPPQAQAPIDRDARKQQLIIRQSSIGYALQTLTHGANSDTIPEDIFIDKVLQIAEKYEAWVMR